MPVIRNSSSVIRNSLVLGSFLWLVFCLVMVLVRGVRWDEDYEFAQVFLRDVVLPSGHPVFQYVRNVFSLQVFSTTALLWVSGSAWWVCAARNFLFLAATVLPPYLIATRLSGRALYGHVAACLVLAGIHLEFDSSYPQFVWPDMFSNGHIGQGFALLTLYFLMSNRPRLAGFLLGVMPCIHAGQLLPVLLFAVMVLLVQMRVARSHARDLLIATGFGILVTAGFWAVHRAFAVAAPAAGPFAVSADPVGILKNYIAFHDLHRRIPGGNCHLALAGLLFLAGLGAAREKGRHISERLWTCLFLYAAAIAVTVYPIMLAHVLLGIDTPPILLRWMPYRLLNHAPVLLVAALCAMLVRREEGAPPRSSPLLPLVLMWCVAVPVLHSVLPGAVFTRYASPVVGALFVLFGAALAQQLRGADGSWRPIAPPVCVFAALACFHQFGAACAVAGFGAAWLSSGRGMRNLLERGCSPAVLGAVASILLAVLTYTEWTSRTSLPRSAFETRVAAYLDAQDEKQALLVGAPFQLLLQARTGHPVMTDMALPSWIPYMPNLGPAVDEIYQNIYGVSFLDTPGSGHDKDWRETWAARTAEEWRKLGDRFSFQYVVAPREMPLPLPLVLQDDSGRLFSLR